MARAREIPGLDCEEPFSEAAVRVIRMRASEVFEHADGVLEVEEPEPLHDMRVAARRLRAALEAFEQCFPRKRWRNALRRVKALGDALGERRDRDVQIQLLLDLASQVDAADRAAFDRLLGRLRHEQVRANDELGRSVRPAKMRKLYRRLEWLLEAAER